MKDFQILIASFLKSVCLLLLWRHLPSPLLLSLNALVSAAFGWVVLKRSKIPLYPAFFFVVEACAPVFSTVAILFYITVRWLLTKVYTKTLKSSYRLPFGEAHYKDFISLNQERISNEIDSDGSDNSLHDSFQIEPFLDIIEGVDLELKINAIGKLAGLKTKESITLLKLALEDEHYEVRYFASNSLSLMEKSFVGEIEAYNQNISRYGSDFQNYTLRGLAYLNMFYLGIIDKSIGGVFLEQALYNFLYSLQLNPDQTYLYVKILEIYVHQREYDKVLELLPTIMEKDLPEEDRVKILFYRAEAHFNQGDFAALSVDCRDIGASTIKVPLMQEALEFWGGVA